MYKRKPKEITPYLKRLLVEHFGERGAKEGLDLNVYYLGRTVPGNSGGPLVDKEGKVIAVCHGPAGTLGKETAEERFVDFRPILEEIIKGI